MVVRIVGAAFVASLAATTLASRPSIKEHLQSLQDRLSKEGDKDKGAYDKVGCWCKTYTKEKSQLIDDSQQELTTLGFDIKSQTAETARLNQELKSHQEELDTSTQELNTAVALRDKESDKFQEVESSQVASIGSLESALKVIEKSHGHEMSLGQARLSVSNAIPREVSPHEVPDVSAESPAESQLDQVLMSLKLLQLKPRSKRAQAQLLQLKTGFKRSAQSPDVIQGILKEMHGTFSEDLKQMREDEKRSKEQHEGLAKAKTQQISALKKQVLEKGKRAADNGEQVAEKKKKKESLEKLVESNQAMLIGMKEFCALNDDSFQARQEARQAELVALSSAQADVAEGHSMEVMGGIAGGFLATSYRASKDDGIPMPGSGASEVCMAGLEIVEEGWRGKAKAACEDAKAGRMQEAADAYESLKDEIAAAQKDMQEKQAECAQTIQDQQTKAAQIAKEESARADVIGNEKQDAEAELQGLNDQIASNEKAAASLSQARDAQHQVMEETRFTALSAEKILKRAAGSSPKIRDAMAASEKLVSAGDDFDRKGGEEVQQVLGLIDAAKRVATKALIPLKIIHAEAEEDAISIREEQDRTRSAAAPTCDAGALGQRAARYGSYAEVLGKASEALAYEALR